MSDWLQIVKIKDKQKLFKLIDTAYSGKVDNFINSFDEEITQLIRKDLKKAGLLVNGAKSLFILLPREYTPRFYAVEGRYYHWVGNDRQALISYKKSLKLFQKQKDYLAMARIRRGLMDVYMYLGKYKQAIEEGKKSLNYFRRKNSLNDSAQVMTNIGNIYHRMDNNRLALQYYDKAKKIFKKKGGIPLALVEYNRANVYANLNQLKKARSLYEYASFLYKKEKLTIAEAQAIYSLAYLYFLEDNYTKAISILERVNDLFVKHGDRKSAAITQLDLIEINIQLNQYGSAIMLGEQLVETFRNLGMRYEEAKAYYFVAWARIKLGDFKPAGQLLRRAAYLFSKENNKLWLGMTNIAKSNLYIAQKNHLAAQDHAKKAMIYFRKSGDKRREIDAEITQIEAILNSGFLKKALKKAMTLLKKELVSYQSYQLYYLLGLCYQQQDNYKKALANFKKSVDIIEKMLAGLYPDEIRFFFVLDKLDSYAMMIDSLLQLNRQNDAFVTNLRALRIINRKYRPSSSERKKVPNELIDVREKLRAVLKKNFMTPTPIETTSRHITSYVSVERKLWSNERKIRSFLYPRKQTSKDDFLKDDKLNLHNFETVVSFITLNDKIGAFCVSKANIYYHQYQISKKDLSMVLRKLHFLFEKDVLSSGLYQAKNSMNYYLEYLYKELIQPIENRFSSSELIILVDDIFSQIPFMALIDERKIPLFNKFKIKIIVNPEELIQRKNKQLDFHKRVNSIFAVSSDMLPAIELEAKQIDNFYPESLLYTQEKANLKNLTDAFKKTNGFLHIAAHASRSSENPLFSRIMMSDAPFFPFDLFGHGLKTKLVTLSGCQTAAPGLYYGNSFSLAKAFYQAGSDYVLASLWPVSDKISMIFMVEFYKNLDWESDIFTAYRKAVKQVCEITDNPSLWGAFVLLGL